MSYSSVNATMGGSQYKKKKPPTYSSANATMGASGASPSYYAPAPTYSTPASTYSALAPAAYGSTSPFAPAAQRVAASIAAVAPRPQPSAERKERRTKVTPRMVTQTLQETLPPGTPFRVSKATHLSQGETPRVYAHENDLPVVASALETAGFAGRVGPESSGLAPHVQVTRAPSGSTATFDPAAIEERRMSVTGEDTASQPQRPSRPQRTSVAVPSVVPQEYRKAVAKHGQRLNAALQGTGVTGPEYLGHLLDFESAGTWDNQVKGPAIGWLGGDQAQGIGQFIPSTRADFVERLGVDPYKSPKQSIKAASMHASGDFGYGALYAGYNPGYDGDPIMPRAEAHDNASVKVKRKSLERTASGEVQAGGAAPTPEKAPGEYAGSMDTLGQLIGPRGRGEDWMDKEPRAGVASSLHDDEHESGYAADLSTDEAIIDRIARKLGKHNPGSGVSPESVDYGNTEVQNMDLQYKGYDVEWLPYTHGSGPHNHIGLEWTGGSPPAGTTLGGSTPASSGGGYVPTASASGLASSSTPAGGLVSGIRDAARANAGRPSMGLKTLDFSASAPRPEINWDRAVEEGEIDPVTGEPIEPRYRPRRRRS